MPDIYNEQIKYLQEELKKTSDPDAKTYILCRIAEVELKIMELKSNPPRMK